MIAVTGANGFLGKALCEELHKHGLNPSGLVRNLPSQASSFLTQVGEIDSTTDWTKALRKVDTVIHCAARVHMMKKSESNAIDLFRKVNVSGTSNLAQQAATIGVRRFIYLSSIKVNGEKTELGTPFTSNSQPNPYGSYAISKYEAEESLKSICNASGMDLVIIRPPLIYGPGVKGNFLYLLKLVEKKVPLPFGLINNLRSMVALDNIVNFILDCIFNKQAINKTFLISDNHDLSTPQLIERLSDALGLKCKLYNISPIIFKMFTFVIGKRDIYERIHGSLQVDINQTMQISGWAPVVTIEDQLSKLVNSNHG